MPLIDSFGRVHNNLRISVTDRCNLRCVYCMPEEVVFQDRDELLSFEEITRFVEMVVPLGVGKIRLTGGEPLLRQHLPRLVAMIAALPGIKDLALTTNGLALAKEARALHDAGLRRITVSLDTLDPVRFRQIARRDGLEQVLQGIDTARRVGFEPIKINAICIRGVNDADVVPLAQFARRQGVELRFIEYMPIGDDHWQRGKVYFAHEILEQLEREVCPLVPAENYDRRAPAMEFSYVDGGGRVGIIASVSRPFCMSCNRIRLTADGKLRNCLFALEETDIKTLLRQEAPVEAVQRAVRQSVLDKWEGHEINSARFIKPLRTMHAIGG
jgi:cyclic pyranopterin phosphate synthase